MPSGTGDIKLDKDSPSKFTPAFANAKSGIIKNATYGEIACSIFTSREKSLSLLLCGIVDAKRTPAIVACIPDLYVKNHINKQINKYGENIPEIISY